MNLNNFLRQKLTVEFPFLKGINMQQINQLTVSKLQDFSCSDYYKDGSMGSSEDIQRAFTVIDNRLMPLAIGYGLDWSSNYAYSEAEHKEAQKFSDFLLDNPEFNTQYIVTTSKGHDDWSGSRSECWSQCTIYKCSPESIANLREQAMRRSLAALENELNPQEVGLI